MESNQTLCSAAWLDLNIDFGKKKLRHCCKQTFESFPSNLENSFFNNSEIIKGIRNDLIKGIEHPSCDHCWSSYKKTGTAFRDFKNKWKHVNDISNNVESIEVSLDNLCDMACIYCDPEFSSRIAREVGSKDRVQTPNKDDINKFIDYLAYDATIGDNIQIVFLGGEVTYSKNFFYFVETMLENITLKNKKVNFSFMTNGNTNEKNMNKIISLLDLLPVNWNISIGISNESMGEVAEYVRHGLDWNVFDKNFKYWANHERIHCITVSPTPCIFTLKHMPSFFEYCVDVIKNAKNTKIAIFGNWVEWPEILDPKHLDISYKKYVEHAMQIVTNAEKVYDDKDQIAHTRNWLDRLHARIGTGNLNLDKVDKFINFKAENKKDKNLYKLRKFI